MTQVTSNDKNTKNGSLHIDKEMPCIQEHNNTIKPAVLHNQRNKILPEL